MSSTEYERSLGLSNKSAIPSCDSRSLIGTVEFQNG